MGMNENAKQALKEYKRKVDAGEIKRKPQRNPREQAADNPKSLRKAINAKCWDCCCENRSEVRDCSALNCPLYHLRPWQAK